MLRRPVAAGAILLAAYACLSLLSSPRGFLGTDTGGKVATLEVMTRGPGFRLDPDIGYWAEEWDPDGSLHPLYYTSRVADGWVNATTLPMLLAAAPLYDVGGYRAALLLPMLGSVTAAFAARALVRRLRPSDEGHGWVAFWVVGLASPLTVYALDCWEHSWGAGLIAWGTVLLWDVVRGDRGWRAAGAAGLLLGLSFSLRTETLVYVAAGGAAAALALWPSLRNAGGRTAALGAGTSFAGGFVAIAVANELLERVLVGDAIRSSRARGAAAGAGEAAGDRLTEAAYTVVGATGSTRGVVLGTLIVVLLAWSLRRGSRDPRFAAAGVVGATLVLLLRFESGLGFVPGLFVAWPLAVASIALGGWRRWPAAVALAALPVVLATQYRGGAAPQWAGRYLLASGLILAALGISALAEQEAAARRATALLSVLVTATGVAWLSARSHDVQRTIAALEARPEQVIVSAVDHLAREGGATYGNRRWLTASSGAQRTEAAEVASAAGATSLLFVEVEQAPALDLAAPGWQRGRRERLMLFDDVALRLTTWTRSG
ncbi:MAG TPA: hypothetical protein VFV35_01775 [Acidimicrobiales bacterium]|nr:hypothetical protein [Acidimicrobiales bacterium]